MQELYSAVGSITARRGRENVYNYEIMPTNEQLYTGVYRIRRFEETVLENFPRGVFYGTTHTYLGQEANAVAILANIREEDIVFSNHRGHGHFLAYGGDPKALFAELMGKATGVCAGRGGSQHLCWRNFYSNGVQGGIVPIATGMALAEKLKSSGSIVIVFLGDGTLGQGVIYESFNMASLWRAPILYVVENNHIAQTTPMEQAVAGEIAARFEAFGIPVCELSSSDVLEILPVAGNLLKQVRELVSPHALVINTNRFAAHSKGDDTRPESVITELRQEYDPLSLLAERLDPQVRVDIENQVILEISAAFELALTDPLPSL